MLTQRVDLGSYLTRKGHVSTSMVYACAQSSKLNANTETELTWSSYQLELQFAAGYLIYNFQISELSFSSHGNYDWTWELVSLVCVAGFVIKK